MFQWLKEQVRRAILQGVNEALAEIHRPSVPQEPASPVTLQLEYREVEEPTGRKSRPSRT
jgi:hypothetical protein